MYVAEYAADTVRVRLPQDTWDAVVAMYSV